jgi:hypothetical protein
MTKKRERYPPAGADKEHNPHAIFAPAIRDTRHGLYRELTKIDGRTRIALLKKNLRGALLEHFLAPAPAVAQIIADRCALKLIRAASFETFVLRGERPAPNADRDYLSLTESIRKDIQALWIMSRDNGPAKQPPDLETYLASLREAGKLIETESHPEPDPEPEPEKTLETKHLF